ncbi:MAG: carph-isopro domain-containing protein [Alphaproteobacteria bacterium]
MSASDSEDGPGHLAAAALIARFGGVRPMAGRLGVPVSTVQGWKQRDAIPLARREQIRAAAAEHGIDLDADMLAPVIDATPQPTPGDAPPSRPAAAPMPRRLTGALAALAGLALVVAAVALAGSLRPELFGARPVATMPGAPSLEPLERRLAAVEARPMADASAAALTARVDALAAKLDDAATAAAEARRMAGAAAGDPATLAALGRQLTALEQGIATAAAERRDLTQRLQAMAQAGDTARPDADMSAFASRLAEVEKVTGAVAALDARVAAAEKAAASADALAALEFRIAVAEKAMIPAGALTALEARIAAAEQASAALGALAQRLDAIDKAFAVLPDIEARLAALEAAQKARGEARGDAAALALAAAGLRRAIGAGEPFADTLVLARKFAGDDNATLVALERLDAVAAKTVPTEAALRADFDAAADAARAAARNEGRTDWRDRALARLEGVVTIRRNDPQGDGPDAVVARAGQRLAAGDLAGADAALATLEGAAAEAVKDWRARAGIRLDALAAAAALEARALERLAAGS